MASEWSIGAALVQGTLFIGVNALVLYVALLASWRLLPAAPCSARLSAAGTIAVGTIVVLVEALGTAGVYTRPAVLLLVLALALLARRRWSALAHLDHDRSAVLHWAGSMSGWGRTLGFVALTAWVRAVWTAVTTLPLGWDSLTYHLPFAATFVQTGRLDTISGPLSMDHYAHFPKNAEMLASWFMLPFHGDVLVGLMNALLLAFAWTALYGLGRALAVAAGDSGLFATAVATSPFLYSFTSSENADVLVFALSIAAVLFLVRWLETDAWADALCAVAASGLALGAKYTALTLAGGVLGVLAVVGLVRLSRRGQTARAWRACLVAAVVLLACGGRQYVLNTVSTGNPVYPLTPRAFGRDLLPGSPYTQWLTSEVGSGTRGDDRFAFSGMFHYYPGWKTPTSAGPKYLGLIVIACLALLGRTRRRSRAILLVVGLAVLVLLVAQVPTTGLPALSRRFWPGSAARLVGVCFGLFAVAAASVPARLRPWQGQALRGGLLVFVARDLVAARAILHPDLALAVTMLASALAVGAASRAEWLESRGRLRAAALLALLAGVLAIAALDRYRSTLSWTGVASAIDVDSAPLEYLRGWSALQTAAPWRVALATDDSRRGQNRFLYPLFGRSLQHQVSYVPVNALAAPGSTAFVLRQDPREDDWRRALAAQQIDHVVVQAPWPIEDGWMQEHPEAFTPVLNDPAIRIYRVDGR